MTLLNEASKVYVGGTAADRVYAGSTLVWQPTATESWGPDQVLYGAGSPLPNGPADPNTFAVGCRIQFLADGRITHFRYYRLSGNPPSQYVAIWSDAGTLLASATTSGDIEGQLNTFPLATPLAVSAGQIVRSSHGYGGSAAFGSFPYSATSPVPSGADIIWVAGCYSDAIPSGGEDDFPHNSITPNHYYGDLVYQKALGYGPDESIYALDATPASLNSYDATFCVGNKIKILADGRITALRYYRPSGGQATRSVDLWKDDGTLLAHATHTGVVGWNSVAITSVDVLANDIVLVAHGYSGSAVSDLWPYTNAAGSSVSPNLAWLLGVYSPPLASGGQDDFPNSVTDIYHYFADIVFQKKLS